MSQTEATHSVRTIETKTICTNVVNSKSSDGRVVVLTLCDERSASLSASEGSITVACASSHAF